MIRGIYFFLPFHVLFRSLVICFLHFEVQHSLSQKYHIRVHYIPATCVQNNSALNATFWTTDAVHYREITIISAIKNKKTLPEPNWYSPELAAFTTSCLWLTPLFIFEAERVGALTICFCDIGGENCRVIWHTCPAQPLGIAIAILRSITDQQISSLQSILGLQFFVDDQQKEINVLFMKIFR